MNVETMHVLGVKRDLIALGPNATYEVSFTPSNGLLRIYGNEIGAHPFVADTINEPLVDEPQPNPIFEPMLSASNSINLVASSTTNLDLINTPDNENVVFLSRSPFDNGIIPSFGDPIIEEVLPKIDVEIFREGYNSPYLSKEEMNGFRRNNTSNFRLNITDIRRRRLGVSPERWVIKFTNISNMNISFNPRILYTRAIRVESTILSLDFLRRPINQILNALELKIILDGDDFRIDTADEVLKENFGFISSAHSIPGVSDTSIVGLHDIRSTLIEFNVNSKAISGKPGVYPEIELKMYFEEDSDEISIKYLPDLNLTEMFITFKLSMSSTPHTDRESNDTFNQQGHKFSGDFDRIPKLHLNIEAVTNLRFTSGSRDIIRVSSFVVGFALGTLIPGSITGIITGKFLSDTIDDFVEDFEKVINEQIQKFLKNNISQLTSYFELGFEKLVNRDLLFHGIIANENSWEVLLGPSVSEFQTVRSVRPIGATATTNPIDGEQSDRDLEHLNKINHIVFLMLENRSYDHVLGHLSLPAYGNNPLYKGLRGRERNSIKNLKPDAWPNPQPASNYAPGPSHGHMATMEQIADGSMSGFANQHRDQIRRSSRPYFDARTIMNFHTPGQLCVYDMLIEEYTVATQWFSSFPGGTWPNRFCVMTGSTPILENSDLETDDFGYLKDLTIFDLLNEANIDWRFYEHDLTFLRFFNNFRLNSNNIKPFLDFKTDVTNRNLPPVMFIDPSFSHVPGGGAPNDDHPSFASTSMQNGQALVKDVITGLKASNSWNDTLLVVTYDEHGGFYDHMPPPGSSVSNLNNVAKVHPSAPNMMGVRVPAFIVSPRAEKGGVIDRVFDHTSILKTILARFIPEKQNRLGPRVAQAAHLGGAVSRDPRIFAPDFPVVALSNLRRNGKIEKGDFHSHISTMASPVHLSKERIRRKILRP